MKIPIDPSDRRTFLKLIGTPALAAALPLDLSKALAIPAHNRTGSIEDIEHIVILMQDNRSFDHYFGTMRGVRGFADPRAVKLPSGQPVWYQPWLTVDISRAPGARRYFMEGVSGLRRRPRRRRLRGLDRRSVYWQLRATTRSSTSINIRTRRPDRRSPRRPEPAPTSRRSTAIRNG